MPFTILFVVLALLLLVVIFVVTFQLKGVKTALIVTGIAFIVSAILFVMMINAIVTAM